MMYSVIGIGFYTNLYSAHQQAKSFGLLDSIQTTVVAVVSTQMSKLRDNFRGHENTVLEDLKQMRQSSETPVLDTHLLHRIDHAIDGYIAVRDSQGLQELIDECIKLKIPINNIVAEKAHNYFCGVKNRVIQEEAERVKACCAKMNENFKQATSAMKSLELSIGILAKLNNGTGLADATGGEKKIHEIYRTEQKALVPMQDRSRQADAVGGQEGAHENGEKEQQ